MRKNNYYPILYILGGNVVVVDFGDVGVTFGLRLGGLVGR